MPIWCSLPNEWPYFPPCNTLEQILARLNQESVFTQQIHQPDDGRGVEGNVLDCFDCSLTTALKNSRNYAWISKFCSWPLVWSHLSLLLSSVAPFTSNTVHRVTILVPISNYRLVAASLNFIFPALSFFHDSSHFYCVPLHHIQPALSGHGEQPGNLHSALVQWLALLETFQLGNSLPL